MTALQIIQGSFAVAWVLVLIYTVRPTLRLAAGLGDAATADAGLTFMLAFVNLGFFVKWAVWPQAMAVMSRAEMSFWLALYVASTLVAMGKVGAQVARRGWLPWRG